jgi:hypothetical protein
MIQELQTVVATTQAIWLPVIVSVITTMAIEYLAKPRLEARKARLIRDRQQIDEVVFMFQKVSLSIAGLSVSGPNPALAKYNIAMLKMASASIYDLISAMSRLSHKYVEANSAHIGSTMKFTGYLLAKVETALNPSMLTLDGDPSAGLEELKTIASDLGHFDTYFLAHVEFKDSQEKWAKRAFWKLFTHKDYTDNASKILEKYGL